MGVADAAVKKEHCRSLQSSVVSEVFENVIVMRNMLVCMKIATLQYCQERAVFKCTLQCCNVLSKGVTRQRKNREEMTVTVVIIG